MPAAGTALYAEAVSLPVRNDSPLAARVRDSLQRTKVPLVIDCTDAGMYDFADPSLRPWFDRDDAEDHIRALAVAGKVGDREADALRRFVTDGYLVVDGLIDDQLI